MRRVRTAVLLAPTLVAACAGGPDRQTLGALREMEPDVKEVQAKISRTWREGERSRLQCQITYK